MSIRKSTWLIKKKLKKKKEHNNLYNAYAPCGMQTHHARTVSTNLNSNPVIRLSTFENNSFEPFKTINKETFELLKSDCSILKLAYTQFVVFKNLQLNLKDYFDFIKKWSNVPADRVDFSISTNIHFVMHANKLILNTLMSFKFFLDNAEFYLKRKYGKSSSQATDFLLLTNKIYDNSFAYRFLYKLRNYSVHLGFPLEVVNFDIKFNSENPEKSEHNAKLFLNKELLLKEKDLFGAKVYNEIKDYGIELDLIPLMNELSHHIMEFQKFVYRIQKDELTNSIENIELFTENKKTETNQIKVYYNYKEKGEKISFSVYDVPFEILIEYKNWC